MSKQEVEAIIDRSGSMLGKEIDTIGGINSTIDQLKHDLEEEQNTEVNLSIKFFDHEDYYLMESQPIKNVNLLSSSDLKPRGQTALYDAMGKSLNKFINMKNSNADSFNSCVIYVATDGYENSSRLYNSNNLAQLISEAKTKNIELLYLAANQDAILEAQKFGLSSNNAINYSETSHNTNAVYRSAASAVSRNRRGQSIDFTHNERSSSLVNGNLDVSSSQSPVPPTPVPPTPVPPVPPVLPSAPVPQVPTTPLSNVNTNGLQVPVQPNSLANIPEWKQHAFLDAAKSYRWDIVKGMLEENSCLINCNIANRWTVLHQAAQSGNIDIVRWLVNKGADKHNINRDGNKPYQVAINAISRQELVVY
jgi:uncharacterized protein YegL